jgi:hypothetical protein
MPLLTGVVARYDVAITALGTVAVPKLTLHLDTVGTTPIALFFVPSPPDRFVVFGEKEIDVFLEREAFADTYHVLQSERPLFVSVQDLSFAGRPLRSFVLSTSEPEPIGEGEADASAVPGVHLPPGVGPDPSPFTP